MGESLVKHLVVVLVAAISLLFLYIASAGPVVGLVFWLGSHDLISIDQFTSILAIVYFPLEFGLQYFPIPVQTAFAAYVEFFIVMP